MGGCWGWDTRPWAVFDSIRWGQQGQTQGWVLRAESPSLCSVWKLSQLCSLILQLNQSRGKSEQKWVCGGAGVHVGLGDGEGRRQWGRMETMGNGCCPSQHVPPLQHLDELPSLSPLSRAQIWHSEGFFFPFLTPRVSRSRDFSYDSWSLGCQIALWRVRLTRCLQGAHSSPSWSCLLWGCPAACLSVPQAVSQSVSPPALPACPRMCQLLSPSNGWCHCRGLSTEQGWAKICSDSQMNP